MVLNPEPNPYATAWAKPFWERHRAAHSVTVAGAFSGSLTVTGAHRGARPPSDHRPMSTPGVVASPTDSSAARCISSPARYTVWYCVCVWLQPLASQSHSGSLQPLAFMDDSPEMATALPIAP